MMELYSHRFADLAEAQRAAGAIQSLVDCPLGAAFRAGDLQAHIYASKVEWEPVLYLSVGARAAARLAGLRLPESEGVVSIEPLHHRSLMRPASIQAPPPAAEVPGSPLRVLIVEDHRDTADALAELIRGWGFAPVVATTGNDALRKATEFRPRVVLLDLGLPDQHGYAVARAMRQQTDLGRLSFIVITGWAQPVDQHLSMSAGISHHLVKPVNPQALRLILEGYKSQAATADAR